MIILVCVLVGLLVLVSVKYQRLLVSHTELTTKLALSEETLEHAKSQSLSAEQKELSKQNKELLEPLQAEISKFKTRLEDLNTHQTKERAQLKQQIIDLGHANREIVKNAEHLTNALTHDNKAQGDWGEMQLELILEGSGLKEGVEYHKQMAFRDAAGNLKKPDFIVHLPRQKDIIIDSKVSLKDFTAYTNSGDELALRRHIKSIEQHINGISLKSYEQLEGVHTLDFIFVFFPIEASLLAAIEVKPELFNDAIKKNVALVSPSTLMMSLKVVSHIWDIEKQNKNTEEIIRLAGEMYDKFHGMISSLDTVKTHLDKATESYIQAKNRLSEGRGNALTTANKIIELGVKTSKSTRLKK